MSQLPDSETGTTIVTVVPDWVKSLKALVPVASTLVTVATNPVQFLRGPVLEIVLQELVIGPAAWVYGYVLQAFGIVADAIDILPPILTDPFRWVADIWVAGIATYYSSMEGLLGAFGLGAPIAGAAATAILLVILLTLALAIWNLIPGTDTLEGITQWAS